MVTTIPLGQVMVRLPSPRSAVSWAVGFSILLHIALGWYFVSRLMIASTLPEPEPIVIEVQPPVAPPKQVPPPEIKADEVKQELPKRPQRPVEPVQGAAAVETSPFEAGPPVEEAQPAYEPAPAIPAMAPKPTRRVHPVYPDKAITADKNGTVEVYVTVGTGGAVVDAEIVREDPKNYGFGKAALTAVKRWEFADAAPGTYRVTVKFKLGD